MKRKDISPHKLATAKRLYERLVPYDDIARFLGVSMRQVWYLVQDHGWQRFHPETGQLVTRRHEPHLTREQVQKAKQVFAIDRTSFGVVAEVLGTTSSIVEAAIRGVYPYDEQSLMTLEEHLKEMAKEDATITNPITEVHPLPCPSQCQFPHDEKTISPAARVEALTYLSKEMAVESLNFPDLAYSDKSRLRREIIDELIAIFQQVRDAE